MDLIHIGMLGIGAVSLGLGIAVVLVALPTAEERGA